MPGVDGLRALAVLAVVVYHLGAGWLPGGFLGVDVFLVISGYLITSLLLAEHSFHGHIDLLRFWGRRAVRLLPALLVMLLVVMAVMVVLHPGEVARVRGALVASLAYVANWYFIAADVPYFEQFGRPSVFLHLWSLAVEEQFYLLWPPLLVAGLLFARRGVVLGWVLAAMAASTALAWVLWQPAADPSRVYYGTDTRAVGLLAGVALAFVVPAVDRVARGSRARAAARRHRELLGVACLGVVVAGLLFLGDTDRALYQGGFLAIALATAGLVAVVAHPDTRLGRAFAWGPLVWIGLRSYALYLWHWPVIMLTRPGVDVPLEGPALVALQVGLMAAAAALSYRYVERPIRRLGFGGTVAAVRGRLDALRRPVRLAGTAVAGSAAVGLVAAIAFLPASSPVVPGITGVASAVGPMELAEVDPAAPGARGPFQRGRRPLVPPAVPPPDPRPPHVRRDAVATWRPPVLMVGDSVMLGARGAVERHLGRRAVVDAAVSRQFPEGADTVRGRLRGLPRGTPVVLHLGTNGVVPGDGLTGLLRELSGVPRVVLVNVRVDRPWEEDVNRALTEAAARRDNVVLADWSTVAAGDDLLADGVHTNPRGARLYARTIADALG
ncbi:MAG: acyltransferase family protein [Miltoncostaeaceae bacterium]